MASLSFETNGLNNQLGAPSLYSTKKEKIKDSVRLCQVPQTSKIDPLLLQLLMPFLPLPLKTLLLCIPASNIILHICLKPLVLLSSACGLHLNNVAFLKRKKGRGRHLIDSTCQCFPFFPHYCFFSVFTACLSSYRLYAIPYLEPFRY